MSGGDTGGCAEERARTDGNDYLLTNAYTRVKNLTDQDCTGVGI